MQTLMFIPKLAPKAVVVKPVSKAFQLVQELRAELVSYTYQLLHHGATLPPGQIQIFAKKYAGFNHMALKEALQGLAWHKQNTVVQIIALLKQLNSVIANSHNCDIKRLASLLEKNNAGRKISFFSLGIDEKLKNILSQYLRQLNVNEKSTIKPFI